MPRNFYNLSSIYAFLKAALNPNIHAIHLPKCANPYYHVVTYGNKNTMGVCIMQHPSKEKLLAFDLTETPMHDTLIVNLRILNKRQEKILNRIFLSFVKQYATACGHKSIHFTKLHK